MMRSVPRPVPPNIARVASSIAVRIKAPITGPPRVPTPPRIATSAILIDSEVAMVEPGSMNSSFCA